jgi:hypothetical protein
MGFDGPIPPQVKEKLPADLSFAKSVLDVVLAPGGRQWWDENGSTFKGTFDLKAGSRSREVFKQYLQKKANAWGANDAKAGN